MKTIKAEILMIEGAPFPVIKEIYDPSNERRNGTITPFAYSRVSDYLLS